MRHTVDSTVQFEDDQPMTNISREELNDKLSLVEQRMDSRVEKISSKVDLLTLKIDGYSARVAAAAEGAEKASERAAAAADRAGGLKTTMYVTAISSFLSVVAIAVGLFYATQASNVSFMQTTLAAVAEGRAQMAVPSVAPPTPSPSQAPAAK